MDFALITLTGNLTRYLMVRPIVERDTTVLARWYPLRTWIDGDIFSFLPIALRVRMRHFADGWRFLLPPWPDAAVIHAFETFPIYVVIHRLLRTKTIIVHNPDGDADYVPKRGLSRIIQRVVLESTDLFVPWSSPMAKTLAQNFAHIPSSKVLVLHPGIDLAKWPRRLDRVPGERFRLLFVGADFGRKGGDTLLDAYEHGLTKFCDLEVVTQAAYISQPLIDRMRATPGLRLHLNLTPNSAQLRRLYHECDALVLPTNADASSWVALEAMATGIPVITTETGGIVDIIENGSTGLTVPAKDPRALVKCVRLLRNDDSLRASIVTRAHAHVQAHFDARMNTELLLARVKALIDERH